LFITIPEEENNSMRGKENEFRNLGRDAQLKFVNRVKKPDFL
jgi:hypothetical protein